MTVVYILGSARSGSSLLSRLVGELDGCFATAETRLLWHGFDERRCGCGEPVRDCAVWAGAIAHATDRSIDMDPARIIALQHRSTRTRHVRRVIAGTADRHPATNEYGEMLGELYRGLAAVTGAGVIVDSSKAPAEAALLSRTAGVDCRIVHLVRDPRAVAYSWARAGRKRGSARRQSMGATVSRWLATNVVAERVCDAAGAGRSLRLRYEDLVADPDAALGAIARLAGTGTGRSDERLGSRHMVGGNALRFAPEPVVVRADTEWVGALPRRASTAITAACWPLLARYGYPLAVHRGPSLTRV